jgi:hypothetical protein
MAENKTKPTEVSVTDFIASVKNDTRREDAKVIVKLLKKITGKKPKMWGPTIIGFDQYHYRYESGHEGDICMIGFSPRSANLVFYIMPGFKNHDSLLAKLGKCKTSKACIYVNKLADIDLNILETLLDESYRFVKTAHG